MIPGKDTTVEKVDSQKEKYGSFALFDIEHFLRMSTEKLDTGSY